MDHYRNITFRYELIEEGTSIKNWMEYLIEKSRFFSLLNLFVIDAIYQRLLYSVTIHYVIENREKDSMHMNVSDSVWSAAS